MTHYPCPSCEREGSLANEPRPVRIYLYPETVGMLQCQRHWTHVCNIDTVPRDPAQCVPFILEQPDPLPLTRVAPYASNPERRLRRLRRLFNVTREKHSEFAPIVPMGVLYESSLDDEYASCDAWARYGSRIEKANLLVQTELEWACKTAMESIGGKW